MKGKGIVTWIRKVVKWGWRQLLSSIDSFDFSTEEFKDSFTVEELCNAIEEDGYSLAIVTYGNTIDWLNDLLTITDLYERIFEKKQELSPSNDLHVLAEKTKGYRSKYFLHLTKREQNLIKHLNRLLIEECYLDIVPKSSKVVKRTSLTRGAGRITRTDSIRSGIVYCIHSSAETAQKIITINGKNFSHSMLSDSLQGNLPDGLYDSVHYGAIITTHIVERRYGDQNYKRNHLLSIYHNSSYVDNV